MMASREKASRNKSRYPQRSSLPNAVDMRDEKRKLYLKKSRQAADEKKWNARSDQVALSLVTAYDEAILTNN